MPTDDEFSTEESTEDTGFDDSSSDETTDDTSTEDTEHRATTSTEDTSTEDTSTEDTSTERHQHRGHQHRGHQHRGHQHRGHQHRGHQHRGHQIRPRTPATEDTSTDDTSTEDTGFDDTTTDDGTFTSDGSAAVGSELAPPFLVADQYPLDSGPHPPWTNLVDAPNFVGAILKAWEGLQYNDGGWFTNNWSAVRDAGGDRYGDSWFRGAYLFLRFASDGAAQADAYLRAVDKAGGWDHGDIIPVVDVELGSEKNSNFKASAEQIVDCTSACADRIRSETGRRVMLYGRGAMRERSITDHMKCDVVWNPSYTAQMVTNGLQAWDLEDIVLWQYCGDNKGFVANLPTSVAGFAKLDISVYIKGAQQPTLQMVRDSLL